MNDLNSLAIVAALNRIAIAIEESNELCKEMCGKNGK